MKIEEELIKTKNRSKMNELKIKAIANLLSKEGIITHEEIEEEVNTLIKGKDNESLED